MKRIYLPLFLFSAIMAPVAAQKVDLKIPAKKGDAASFVYKQNVSQAIDLGGQQMDMGQAWSQEMALKILEVGADGVLTVEVNIAHISGSFELPMMGSVDFDSKPAADEKDGKKKEEEEEEDDPMGGMGMPNAAALNKAVRAMVGRTFTATVDSQGKVKKVEGIQKALEEAKSKSGGGAAMLSSMLSEDTVKQMVEAVFGELPKGAIAAGESWDGDVESDKGRNVPTARKTKLTLAKVDADKAEIAVAGTVDMLKPEAKKDGEKPKAGEGEDEEAQARQMMENAKIENGKITGTISVSRKDGFVLRSEIKMSMDIKAPSPMGGGDMNIGVTSTTTCERKQPGTETTKPATTGAPAKEEPKKATEATKPAGGK